MNKKYELTDEVKLLNSYGMVTRYGIVVCRIKALKDFSDIKAGDLGGWIEKEENLSQEGDCWVYDEAVVCNDATIRENAKIKDYAQIFDFAQVSGNAIVNNNAKVLNYAQVFGNVIITDNVAVKHSYVHGNARISGNVFVDKSSISGNAKLDGKITITGCTILMDSIIGCDLSHAYITSNALIMHHKDYMSVVTNDKRLYAYRCQDNDIKILLNDLTMPNLKEAFRQIKENKGTLTRARRKELVSLLKYIQAHFEV